MRDTEGVGNCGRLAACERADGVDQPAAGLERTGEVIEQRELYGGEFAHVVGRGRPTRVRVALPRAGAAARGVEENTVEFGFRREFRGAVPERGAVIKQFCARSAAFERIEP